MQLASALQCRIQPGPGTANDAGSKAGSRFLGPITQSKVAGAHYGVHPLPNPPPQRGPGAQKSHARIAARHSHRRSFTPAKRRVFSGEECAKACPLRCCRFAYARLPKPRSDPADPNGRPARCSQRSCWHHPLREAIPRNHLGSTDMPSQTRGALMREFRLAEFEACRFRSGEGQGSKAEALLAMPAPAGKLLLLSTRAGRSMLAKPRTISRKALTRSLTGPVWRFSSRRNSSCPRSVSNRRSSGFSKPLRLKESDPLSGRRKASCRLPQYLIRAMLGWAMALACMPKVYHACPLKRSSRPGRRLGLGGKQFYLLIIGR